MKILFMGTPEFAKVSLEFMADNNFDIAGVVTQPDKPQGRKMKMTPPPVKEYALSRNIPVYQPNTLKNQEFSELLSQINPDIIVVAAYGKILPKSVIDYPRYGCVNVHASLLPKHRGTSPINAAIINGDETTGITTIYMDEGIDTGDMILWQEIKIGKNENFGELHDRLAVLGGELLVKTLNQIQNGTAPRAKQLENGDISYAKKIDNDTCVIDWNKSAKEIHNKIRGLSPYIGAFTMFGGKKLKILQSEILPLTEDFKEMQNGEIITKNKKFDVKVKDGIIRVCELHLEGSKKMSAADFVNGKKTYFANNIIVLK